MHYYRDTWMEIRLDAISENVRNIRRHLAEGTELMAVVKADGYGHGAEETAEAALEAGAKWIGVAMLDEALFLRKRGIDAPILVLGYCPPQHAQVAAENRISLTAFQEGWLEEAGRHLTAPLNVHIKCDTGMGRLGVRTLAELDSLLAALKKSNWIRTEGVFTHFAAADTLEGDYYQKQLEKFQAFLSRFPERPEWIHASNSAAALLHPESAFNLVRTGIVMYGLSPSEEIKPALPFPLKPALSLHSRLSHVKKAEKGAKISYGCTYTAEQDEWIGTVPIGYADGWLRDLQGQEVLVNGKRAPIVGRICMDQCMIRLPERVEPGTLVTLIGRQGDEEISADEIARKRNTINYEIVSTLSQRIPRIYKQGEKIVKIKNSLFS